MEDIKKTLVVFTEKGEEVTLQLKECDPHGNPLKRERVQRGLRDGKG